MLGTPGADQATGESFAEGLAAARRNVESKTGRNYSYPSIGDHGPGSVPVGQVVARDLGEALTECLNGARLEAKQVQVVMKVASDGTVSRALASPENAVTTCAVLRLARSKLPQPPEPDYWIVTEVEVTQGVPAFARGKAGPASEGRFFNLQSSEAWRLAQQRLSELGLATDKVDRANQVVLTKWRDFGAKGMEWLPAPALAQGYIAARVRFEVFVSPYAEPARVYVGSFIDVRQQGVPENRGAVYNNTAVSRALMSEIARALRADGVPIPRDPEQRRKLALSILVDAADRCLQQGPPLADAKGPFKPPEKIPVSQFEMQFPLAAATRGEGPVQAEFTVQEDGAVSDVHLLGAYPGYQFEVAAMGPLSLLLYSPAKVNGCPVPAVMTYTINYRR